MSVSNFHEKEEPNNSANDESTSTIQVQHKPEMIVFNTVFTTNLSSRSHLFSSIKMKTNILNLSQHIYNTDYDNVVPMVDQVEGWSCLQNQEF